MSFPTVRHGRLATIDDTPTQLTATSSKARVGVELWSAGANPNTLYAAADPNVTADGGDTTSGVPLVPGGESVFIPTDDPSKVYVIGPAGTAAHKVFWQAA